MTKPRTFRQADVERALRAAKSLGLTVTGFRIEGPRIEVLTGSAPSRELDPYEKWLAEQNGQAS